MQKQKKLFKLLLALLVVISFTVSILIMRQKKLNPVSPEINTASSKDVQPDQHTNSESKTSDTKQLDINFLDQPAILTITHAQASDQMVISLDAEGRETNLNQARTITLSLDLKSDQANFLDEEAFIMDELLKKSGWQTILNKTKCNPNSNSCTLEIVLVKLSPKTSLASSPLKIGIINVKSENKIKPNITTTINSDQSIITSSTNEAMKIEIKNQNILPNRSI